MRLSDDALLALRVMRWALANGWRVDRRHMTFDRRTRLVDWEHDDKPGVTLTFYRDDSTGAVEFDSGDVRVSSVRQAVNLLADVFELIPLEFSSVWAAGRESAYTTDEWRVVAGPAEFPTVFQDEIRTEEHLEIVLRDARNRWRGEEIWVQHRRTGATDWGRVDA